MKSKILKVTSLKGRLKDTSKIGIKQLEQFKANDIKNINKLEGYIKDSKLGDDESTNNLIIALKEHVKFIDKLIIEKSDRGK